MRQELVLELYSISSSTSTSSATGIVIPSCWAVLALIASVNFVGCSMGSSPGLVPCMIYPAYAPALRKPSTRSAP